MPPRIGVSGGEVRTPVGDAPVVPLVVIGAGLYLAWFGVHYWRQDVKWPTEPAKAVLQGKPVQAQQKVQPTAAFLAMETAAASAADGGGGTTPSAAGAATAPKDASETAFWGAVLSTLGAPTTAPNVNSLHAWARREFPSWPPLAKNNPMATTQKMPGSTQYNSVGVQNYPTSLEGVAATAQTLSNGHYPNIVKALKSGQGLCGGGLAADFSTWSGNGYSSVC